MHQQHKIWLAEFLKNCENSNKSKLTIINYHADLKKFIQWYEQNYSSQLNKANAQVINQYKSFLSAELLAERAQQPAPYKKVFSKISSAFKKILKRKDAHSLTPPRSLVSPTGMRSFSLAVSSRRRHLSAIKNFYEYLKQANEDQNKLFPSNPVKPKLHAIKLKEQDVENTKLLKEEDWLAILDYVYKPREKLIVHLLFYGGLRLSELCELKISHFDDQSFSLKFNRKGGYVHHLKLQEGKKIFRLLEEYLIIRRGEGHSSDFLFANKKGKSISSRAMYNTLVKIFKKSHCPTIGLTPHSFRKACATNLYQKTKDLIFVRDYLNHSDAKVTQTYIEKFDWSDEKNLKQYEGLSSL